MATKRSGSNLLALAVLALLAERPTHPYEMDFLMRARGLEHSIKLNRGSLYTVVETLQRDGLIVPQETQREGRRPERTVYALTEAGRAKFGGWHRELMSTPATEYTQFAAALCFIAHFSPTETIALLEERARRLDDEIEERQFTLGSVRERLNVPRLFLLEEEFALAQRAAEVRWVRQIVQEIRNGTLTWPSYTISEGAPVVSDRGGTTEMTETDEHRKETDHDE
ncbi:MAG: PadR family transcriptional regulator [Chloroflexota bacterium]|nr:PadR family transcriptional regulator [Chloroflexota bacterium]